MITFEIFYKQRDKALKDFKSIRKRGNRDYDVFFYLLTGNKKEPNLELKKFDYKTGKDEYLKYSVSSFRKNRKDKLFPILEEVKFREVIMDLPVGGIDEMYSVRHPFLPSGTIVEKISDKKRKVWSYSGFCYVKKFRLKIPEKCFKSVGKK